MRLGLSLGLASAMTASDPSILSINGLTGGRAIIGDHASITMTVSEGTISARKWGSTEGGSEYGTGTSPTDYVAGDGGRLYATATVDGQDYSTSAAITYAAPTQNAAPTATGDAVIGESVTGTSGTFNGSDLTTGSEWEVSDDGATGWTGTGDTDTTSPAQVSGKHSRFATTASNSGGSLTIYSNVIGPAIAPTISMSGLTSGDAIIGDHASITMAANVGTITARKWGSTSGGSQFGTGTNPTDYTAADGGTLYATATVGGIDYTIGADVIYSAPVAAAGLADVSYTTGSGDQTVDASADFTGSGIVYSVSTAIAGVTINSSSGVVTIPTGSDATGTITVTGTNSGGADSTAFGVTIAAGAGTIPTTSTNTITKGSITITLSENRDVFEYPDGSFGIVSTGGDVVVTGDSPAVNTSTHGSYEQHGLMLISDLQPQHEGTVGTAFQGLDETAGVNVNGGGGGVTKPTYAASYSAALNKAPSKTASNLTIATSGGTGGCIKMLRRADRALDDGEIDNSELIEDLLVIHCVPAAPAVGAIPPPLYGTGIELNMSDVDLTVARSFTMPTIGAGIGECPPLADMVDYWSTQSLLQIWEGETRRSMCHIRDYAQAVIRAYAAPAALHILNPATDTTSRNALLAAFLTHANNAYAVQDTAGYQLGGAGQSAVDHFILAFMAALCPAKTALFTKSQARLSNLNELAFWATADDVGLGGRYESRTDLLASSSYHNNQPYLPEHVGEPMWRIQAFTRNAGGVIDETNNSLPSARYCGQQNEIASNTVPILGLVEQGWEAIWGDQSSWDTDNDYFATLAVTDKMYTAKESRVLTAGTENMAVWLQDIWETHRATMPEGGTPVSIYPFKPLQLANEELDTTVGGVTAMFIDTGTGVSVDTTKVLESGAAWTGSVLALTDQELRVSHDTVQWAAPVSMGTGTSGSMTYTGKRYLQYRATNASGAGAWSTVWALFDGDWLDSGKTIPKPHFTNYMGGDTIPTGAPVNAEAPKVYTYTWDEDAAWPEYTALTGTMPTAKTKLVAGAGLWDDGIDETILYQWEERENAGSETDLTGETDRVLVRIEDMLSTASIERDIRCKVTVDDGNGNTTVAYTNWVTMPIAGAFLESFVTDPGALPAVANSGTYAWQSGAESMRIIPANAIGFSGAAFTIDGLTPGQEYVVEADIINKTVSGEVDGLISADLTFNGADTATSGTTSAGMITATLTPAGDTLYILIRLRGNGVTGQYFEVGEIRATPTAPAVTAPAAFTAGMWTSATGSASSEIDIGITTLPDDGGSTITALQYSVDSGTTWAALTGTGTGSRTIDQHSDGSTGTLTADTSYNIMVRAVNAEGNGANSDTKATTTGDVAATVPAAMSAPTVNITSTTALSVDRASAPDDGGSTILSYDLRWSVFGAASWTTQTGIAASAEAIGSLTEWDKIEVQTRAVNAIGAGDWSPSTVGVPRNTTGEIYFNDFVAAPDIGTGGTDTDFISVAGVNGTITSHDAANARLNCNASTSFAGPFSEVVNLSTSETYAVYAQVNNNMGGGFVGLYFVEDNSGSYVNKGVGTTEAIWSAAEVVIYKTGLAGSTFNVSGKMRTKVRSAGATTGDFTWSFMQVRQTS